MNDIKLLLIQTVRTMALGLGLMLLAIGMMLGGVVMSQMTADPRITSNMMLLFYLGTFLLLVGFFKIISGWKDGKDLLQPAPARVKKISKASSKPTSKDTSKTSAETASEDACETADEKVEELSNHTPTKKETNDKHKRNPSEQEEK